MTETEQMLTSLLDCRRVDLHVQPHPLTEEQARCYHLMRARRARGEPLQYILGSVDFMGVPLKVDPRVLIPRPETELLVEKICGLRQETSGSQPSRVLDLGTGSGNIAIALAKGMRPCDVTAVDLSDQALSLAEENARQNQVARHVHFVCEDMIVFLENAKSLQKTFDVIVSNPPYIPSAEIPSLPREIHHEPPMALDGGEDGLFFYKEIIPRAVELLTPKGFVALEIGDHQRDSIKAIGHAMSIPVRVEFYKDYRGYYRIATIWKS